MKINNRKQTAIVFYGFLLIVLLDLLFLKFAGKFFAINNMILYSSFLLVFIFSFWKIISLKSFSMEVSDHIISIKYNHPMVKLRHPVLEVPLHKVISVETKKGIVDCILVIGINTRRGIKNFYYKLGKLSEKQTEKYRQISEAIKYSKMQAEI
ncbi:hypothetical protein [Epilithonimonas sp. UC225_85]|uniref:hypothetical protein n=1 Tax=Epilithonimonas sp. UC225_85 TaxID=3350167 RepID=UPI0036D38CF9